MQWGILYLEKNHLYESLPQRQIPADHGDSSSISIWQSPTFLFLVPVPAAV